MYPDSLFNTLTVLASNPILLGCRVREAEQHKQDTCSLRPRWLEDLSHIEFYDRLQIPE